MIYGPERLIADLQNLGYKQVKLVTGTDGSRYAMIPSYEIQLGRFVGRVIDLAIPATPNFPQSVGASIHVRTDPQLLDYKDSAPNVRNIITSALGNEWRYWSYNFNWTAERTARRLMSQINRIFENA